MASFHLNSEHPEAPNHALQRTAVMSVPMSGVGLSPTGSVTGCAAHHEAPAQPAPSPRAAALTAPASGPLSLSLGSLGAATSLVSNDVLFKVRRESMTYPE